MHTFHRAIGLGMACLLLGAGTARAAQADKDRPRLSLNASPRMGRSPLRAVLTAELTGGANDYEDFYCPTVVWQWGDGTESESTLDCQPYEAGKSSIKRRFTVEHVFDAGEHTVVFQLKRREKALATANVIVEVQPGIRDNP
jgi:hypothetical protein